MSIVRRNRVAQPDQVVAEAQRFIHHPGVSKPVFEQQVLDVCAEYMAAYAVRPIESIASNVDIFRIPTQPIPSRSAFKDEKKSAS